MEAQIQELKKLLNSSKSVLIVMPAVLSTDIISSGLTLFYLLSNIMKKEVMIASTPEIPARFKKACIEFGVEDRYILREVQGLQYVFRIPEIEENMNIDLRRKNGMVELSLMPHVGELNPSMIKFEVIGDKFDLVLAVGAKSLSSLGAIYKKEVFENFRLVNIDYSKENAGYGELKITNEKAASVSEVVYDIFKEMGVKVEENVARQLSRGIIGGTHAFKKAVSNQTFHKISKLTENIKMTEIVDDYLYSLSVQGLKLRKLIFNKMEIDEQNKFAWAVIGKPEFEELDVDVKNLYGMDYLPFDVAEAITNTALIYDTEDGARALIFGKSEHIKSQQYTIHQNGDTTEIITEAKLPELENFVKNLFGIEANGQKSSEEVQPTPVQPINTVQTAPAVQKPSSEVQSKPMEEMRPIDNTPSYKQESLRSDDITKENTSDKSSNQNSDVIKPPFEKAPDQTFDQPDPMQSFGPKPPFTKAQGI